MTVLQYLLKGFLIVLLVGIAPLILGNRLYQEDKLDGKDLFLSYLFGWMKMLALFQVLAIPMIFLHFRLSVLTAVWTLGVVGLLTYYLIRNRKAYAAFLRRKKKIPHLNYIEIIALVLVLAQLFMVTFYTHEDADDAFFVSEAVTAVHTDTMFRYQGDTGEEMLRFNSRYVMSPFPIFLATVSSLIMIHPTIVAHVIFQFIFIPMSYMVFYLLARALFGEERKKSALSIVFLSLLNVWGNISAFTSASFLFFRIWQGKAILATVILPFVVYLIASEHFTLSIRENRMLFLTMLVATMVSSMGIFLGPVLLGMYTLVRLAKDRKPGIVAQLFFCSLPNIALGIGYLIYR